MTSLAQRIQNKTVCWGTVIIIIIIFVQAPEEKSRLPNYRRPSNQLVIKKKVKSNKERKILSGRKFTRSCQHNKCTQVLKCFTRYKGHTSRYNSFPFLPQELSCIFPSSFENGGRDSFLTQSKYLKRCKKNKKQKQNFCSKSKIRA